MTVSRKPVMGINRMNRDIPIQFTPEYEAMLKRAEDKLRGNISSEKMTEEQTQAEIAAVQDGAKSSFEREEVNKGPEIKMNLVAHIEQTPEVVGYVTKSGRVYKSKPGRKPK